MKDLSNGIQKVLKILSDLFPIYYSITINRARPLAQVSYKTAQSATDITGTPTTPIRSSGIVNKAIDLFFGW